MNREVWIYCWTEDLIWSKTHEIEIEIEFAMKMCWTDIFRLVEWGPMHAAQGTAKAKQKINLTVVKVNKQGK